MGMASRAADVTLASMSNALRADSSGIWNALHTHPFLRELAAGTLPMERFRFFIEQDDFYLEEYARCLAMGVARARNEVGLACFRKELLAVILRELPGTRELPARGDVCGAEHRGSGRV